MTEPDLCPSGAGVTCQGPRALWHWKRILGRGPPHRQSPPASACRTGTRKYMMESTFGVREESYARDVLYRVKEVLKTATWMCLFSFFFQFEWRSNQKAGKPQT